MPCHNRIPPTLFGIENIEGYHYVTRDGNPRGTHQHYVSTPSPGGPYIMVTTHTTATPINHMVPMRNMHTTKQDHLGPPADPPNKKFRHNKKFNENNLGGTYYMSHTLKSEGTYKNLIFTDTIKAQRPQAIHTSSSHIPSQECPYPLNDSALRTLIYNMNHLLIQSTLSSQNITGTFCNKSHQNKHRISIVRPTRIRNDPHILTNLNQQSYPKYKLNTYTADKLNTYHQKIPRPQPT